MCWFFRGKCQIENDMITEVTSTWRWRARQKRHVTHNERHRNARDTCVHWHHHPLWMFLGLWEDRTRAEQAAVDWLVYFLHLCCRFSTTGVSSCSIPFLSFGLAPPQEHFLQITATNWYISNNDTKLTYTPCKFEYIKYYMRNDLFYSLT